MSLFISPKNYFFIKDIEEKCFQIGKKNYSMWINQSSSNIINNIIENFNQKYNNVIEQYPNLLHNEDYLKTITFMEIIYELMINKSDINAMNNNQNTDANNDIKNNLEINNNTTLISDMQKQMINEFKQILEIINLKINNL